MDAPHFSIYQNYCYLRLQELNLQNSYERNGLLLTDQPRFHELPKIFLETTRKSLGRMHAYYLNLITNVNDEGSGDVIHVKPVLILEELQARDAIGHKNSEC